VAVEQENRAEVEAMRARVVEAEAEVPRAIAEALRTGKLGVMDYYNLENIQSDTRMRGNIAGATEAGDDEWATRTWLTSTHNPHHDAHCDALGQWNALCGWCVVGMFCVVGQPVRMQRVMRQPILADPVHIHIHTHINTHIHGDIHRRGEWATWNWFCLSCLWQFLLSAV